MKRTRTHLSQWVSFFFVFPGVFLFRMSFTAVSMAEEVRDPSVQVPRAIIWSIPAAFLTGLVFVLPILFTIPDLGILLEGVFMFIGSVCADVVCRQCGTTDRTHVRADYGLERRGFGCGMYSFFTLGIIPCLSDESCIPSGS